MRASIENASGNEVGSVFQQRGQTRKRNYTCIQTICITTYIYDKHIYSMYTAYVYTVNICGILYVYKYYLYMSSHATFSLLL